MSFSNSNLVHFFNTSNLAKVKELTKINTEASILTGKVVTEVLRENYKQTELSKKSLHIAIRNNQALEEMNSNLIDIGKGINVLNRNISKMTDTMREGFAELTKVQKEQTKIHKEHYDKIEKEKALKEILYNMKKYFSALKEMNDPISKAYSAKVLLKLLDEGDLKTKDLSEIKDKEYYDEQILEAKKFISALTPQESNQLENFETLYSSYDLFLNIKPEMHLPGPKSLMQLKEIDLRKFEQKRVSKSYKQEFFNYDRIRELEEKINKNKKMQSILSLLLGGNIVSVFLYLLIVKYFNLKFESAEAVFYILFFLLSSIIFIPTLIGRKIYLYFLNKKDKSELNELKNLYEEFCQRNKKREEEEYLKNLEENKKIEKLIEEEKEIIKKKNEHIEIINSEAKKFNQELELNIKQLKESKKEFMDHLKNELNSFLDMHPKIQEFLPKL